MYITPDGTEYIAYASALLSGSWSQLVSDELAHRTPGYPAILAVGTLIWGPGDNSARYVHALLTALVLLFTCVNLRSYVHPLVTVILFGLVAQASRVFFLCVLSEWSSMMLLILLFSMLARYLTSSSKLLLTFISICCAGIVFIRPALLPALLIPGYLVTRDGPKHRVAGIFIVSASLAPLLAWAAMNYRLHGEFSMSPRNGFCLFTLSSVVGEIHSQDLPAGSDARKFAEEFSARRSPPVRHTLDKRYSKVIEATYNQNMWQVADQIRIEHGWSLRRFGQVTRLIAFKFMRENWLSYLKFTFFEFIKQLYLLDLPGMIFLVLAVLSGLSARKTASTQSLSELTWIFLALHLLHMAFCVLLVHMLYRFFAVTYYPLCFGLAIFAFSNLARFPRRPDSSRL